MTLGVDSEVPQTTRLLPIEGEPDACDVLVANGPVVWVFHFSRIVPQYGKLHALTGVEWTPVSEDASRTSQGLPLAGFSPIHVDWRSGSSIDSFERRVRSYFDKTKTLDIPWPQIMQFAVQRLNEFIFQVGDLQPADWIEKVSPAEYLVYPLWPRSNRPVVWYGQGETGKGMLAIGSAFCACYGINFSGLRTQSLSKGIVYVDYEDSFEEFSVRVSRFAAGMGMAPVPTLRRFDPQGRLFVDIADQLKGKVAALGGTDGYIIDSAIPACGGDVNKPEPVGAFFSSAARLAKPVNVIAHETKESSGDYPFGSNLWRTSAAMTVHFSGSAEPYQNNRGHWIRDILLTCTKANNVKRFSPLAFQLVFTDDEVQGAPDRRPDQASTWIQQIAPASVSLDLQSKLPPLQRLSAYLKGQDGLTLKEISDGTGLSIKQASGYLSRYPHLFSAEGGGRGKGNAARWRVLEGSAA